MHLAINYSPAAASLVKSGQIHIDYFKTPDWDWIIAEAQALRPVAVHFTLEAGNGDVETIDWEDVEQKALATHTPYINLHLDAKPAFFPGIPADSTDPGDRERVLQVLITDVSKAVKRFGAERVIVENSPYRNEAGQTLRVCVEPEVISKVVNETGCGFLLDLSHALISAHYLGMEDEDYFYMLPVSQIKEMHFAGIHKIEGMLVDHLSIQEADWRKLDWALEQVKSGAWSSPWLLAFEYGGVGEVFAWRSKAEVIAVQVPELYDHIKNIDHNPPRDHS